MNHYAASRSYLPTLLLVSQHQEKLAAQSPVLDSFDLVYLLATEAANTLSWVQQYQPDLIILDLEWSQILDLQLTAALRLDWLTRNIPIVILASPNLSRFSPNAKLDCDICLTKPYSISQLEQVICTLVSNPACKSCGIAV